MSLFDWFADRRKGQYVANVKQEPDEGDGLWSKCPECGQVVYLKDLKLNASVFAPTAAITTGSTVLNASH